jgi:hypothetical protein
MLSSLPQMLTALPQQLWGMVAGIFGFLGQIPQSIGSLFGLGNAVGHGAGNLAGAESADIFSRQEATDEQMQIALQNAQAAEARLRGEATTDPSAAQGGVAGAMPSQSSSSPGGVGTGQDRKWRGYVPTDVEALRAQLPSNAKHLAEAFVSAGQKYNIDPLFLASISKLETGSWTSSAFRNKNNAMGISDASGPTMQSSHQSSINTMAAELTGADGTRGYYNGLDTVGEVGVKYAPDGAVNDFNGTNSQWGRHVGDNYDNFANSLRGR